MQNYEPTKEELLLQLTRINKSNVIGRTAKLGKLLDYLIDKEILRIELGDNNIHNPKEIEIAIEVFGKTVDFNSTEDASVRVHISRLRKKLAEYYENEGKNEHFLMSIPVGEYRLCFLNKAYPNEINKNVTQRNSLIFSDSTKKTLLAFYIITSFILLAFFAYQQLFLAEQNSLNAHPFWQEYQQPQTRNLIVLGAKFAHLNKHDSSTLLATQEAISKRAVMAFKNILSISSNFRNTPIILAAELSARDIKTNNIIYIGHFDDMGMLKSYFNSSNFQYNHREKALNAKNTDDKYLAPSDINQQYVDYGLFAKIDGPSKSKIYIFSGFTDSSLLWLSWFLTSDEQQLQSYLNQVKLAKGANTNNNLELLFKIPSIKGTDMSHKLIYAASINSTSAWNVTE